MNIFSNVINMYNEDPIKVFMIIAIIYLIFNSMNINENFIASTSISDVNLNVFNKVSELSNKWKKAFSIDNNGNITFKKNIIVNGKSEFDDNVKLKEHIQFRPINDANTHIKGSYAIAASNPNASTKGFYITRRTTNGEWEATSVGI